MRTTRLLGLIVLTACLASSPAWGQSTPYLPTYGAPSPMQNHDEPEAVRSAAPATAGLLSDWIVYKRDCCEGKHGVVTPVYTEVYLRAGPSIPVGNELLSQQLQTGWSIAGGAQLLLFNEPMNRAWVVDAHLINTNESGIKDGTQFPITIFRAGTRLQFGANGVPGVTIKYSNRTLAGLGVGREWYLWQPADADGRKWRVGADVGGRYGSHNLAFRETRHTTDVIGAMYAAAHTDVEFCCRNLLWHAGVRLEWAYTWSDILHRTSDVQDISVLLNVGLRY